MPTQAYRSSEPIRPNDSEKRHVFSVIIPVIHEGATIYAFIQRLHQQFSHESFETIVVDGDAEGSTLQKLPSLPGVVKTISPPGRGHQMNAGARLAQGEILLFLHADTGLPKKAFAHIRRVMADKRYVAGAFKLGFESERWIFKVLEVTTSWRSRLTRLPYGDQAFFMSKAYFSRIGGFREIPIMEDVDLMRRIKHRKEQVHVSTTVKIKTSVRRWEQEGLVYSFFRTWILVSLYFLGWPPEKLAQYYRADESSQEQREWRSS